MPNACPRTEAELDDLLSLPTAGVIATLEQLPGDLVILGVAGKMGPTLARMARRAADAAGSRRRIIGVARFTGGGEAELQAHGIETLRCDLLDAAAVDGLPDAPNVVFMTGMKFGSSGNEAATWAMNSYLPGLIARRYRSSRLIAFSTGNVYGITPVAGGGSHEDDTPAPVGEYAMSCLGRERVFEHFSRTVGTPMTLIRLNYACELRYGVIVDLAQRVWAGKPIDLTTGHFNVIWQGDANALALCMLADTASPPLVLNLTGPELLSVREVCEQLGRIMNRPVRFSGTESGSALLSDARRALVRYGPPRVSASQLIDWIADWTMRDGRTLNRPTHFEARDGRF